MSILAHTSPWRRARLGDIAKTASGGTPKRTVPAYYGGDIPWVKSGELGDSTVHETEETISKAGLDASSAKVFPKGTLCIALYGATVGKLGILGLDAATNQAVCGIFLPDFVDTKFAYRFLESQRRELIELGKGGAQSNISQEIIRNLELPLPPIEEQREIVAEIDKQFSRLEAGVAGLRRVRANLKRYRAAVLKAACEGKLVPTEAELARQEGRTYETGAQLLERILAERRQKWNGKGKYKEPAAANTENLPPLAEGWIWSTFDQLTTLITKGSSPNWQGFHYCDQGIVFVRSENVRWGKLDLTDVAYLPPAFNEKERKSILREGDVLLNLVGASIGRAAVATPPVSGGNVNQAVAVIRLVHSDTANRFVTIWLTSAEAQKRIHAEKVDVARANFSLEDTRLLPIPLPPLVEQQRIVAEVEGRLSVVEELESMVNANLQRATSLRQSILQQAFEGDYLCGVNETNGSDLKIFERP